MKTSITLFLALLISITKLSALEYSVCKINKIYSPNKFYFLVSIPFDNTSESGNGKTLIFTQDSVKLYEIPRYFDLSKKWRELFLSNDGAYVISIINREYSSRNKIVRAVTIYNSGKLSQEYSINDIFKCNSDKEECYLFYDKIVDSVKYKDGKRVIYFNPQATVFERKIYTNSSYFNGYKVLLFTKPSIAAEINLKNSSLSTTFSEKYTEDSFNKYDTFKVTQYSFKTPSCYGMPNLANGKTIEQGLAKFLDMKVYPEYSKNAWKYKKYTCQIACLIDTNGKAVIDEIENYDSLPIDKIETFLSEARFNTSFIPIGIEKWRCEGWIHLMNKNPKIARQEKLEEERKETKIREKERIADSIDGVYIPKNLEECFIQLDTLLKEKDILAIKNLKSREETIQYHHGLGMWLRNNWGLWGGSRLQTYLGKNGLDHPDNMSALILEYYYDWLNNNHEGWKAFDAM